MKIVSRKDMESTAFESASLFLVMAVLLIGCAGGGLRGSGMDSASGEGGSSLGGDVGLGGTSTGGVGGVSLVGGASGAGQTKGGSGGHFSLGGPSAGVGGASLPEAPVALGPLPAAARSPRGAKRSPVKVVEQATAQFRLRPMPRATPRPSGLLLRIVPTHSPPVSPPETGIAGGGRSFWMTRAA